MQWIAVNLVIKLISFSFGFLLSEYKVSVGSCPQVLHVSFRCFHGFELISDPSRGRLGGLGGKAGSMLVRNLRTTRLMHLRVLVPAA